MSNILFSNWYLRVGAYTRTLRQILHLQGLWGIHFVCSFAIYTDVLHIFRMRSHLTGFLILQMINALDTNERKNYFPLLSRILVRNCEFSLFVDAIIMQFNKISAASCLAREMSVLKYGNRNLLFLSKSCNAVCHRTWKCLEFGSVYYYQHKRNYFLAFRV